jgi:hypothetical protein
MVRKDEVNTEQREHDKCLDILERAFNEKGFTTIREGKMCVEGRHWKEPDLFVLKDNKLLLILEVIAEPSYRRVLTKVKRIKQRYNSRHMVVFEPIVYIDKKFLGERKEHFKTNYVGRYPRTFKEIEEFCIKKWRKEEGIEVSFWNESDYQFNIEKLMHSDEKG